MILIGRHSETVLRRQLERSRQDRVTYPEVGSTRSPALPAGYRHDSLSAQIGRGDIAWERAKQAIQLWKAHAKAGIRLTPADAPVQEGTTVLASITLGRATVVAPCRVVYVTDEPTRFGFAYGTLPGHPERGEEAFHVDIDDDGTVTAEIIAFSRPGDLAAKLAGPIAREIQKTVTRLYLAGIRGHVAGTK